jgi:hypothetical protein
MKSYLKSILLSISLLIFIVSFTSCASGRTNATSPKGDRAAKVAYNPVSQKKDPIRKKFIIKNKQRKILGTKPLK